MAKKLPKELFVCWHEDRDEFWLNAAESAEELAELGETIDAGCYVLKNKVKIKSEVATEIS